MKTTTAQNVPDQPDDLSSLPAPRTSTFRTTVEEDSNFHPHSSHTRAMLEMVRIGDLSNLVHPAQIFHAYCEAVAPPLGVLVAVMIHVEGLPRSSTWKAEGMAIRDVDLAESHAWSSYVDLCIPELAESLPADHPQPPSSQVRHWAVQALGVPMFGLLQVGTTRQLTGTDLGLLKFMSVRIAVTLDRLSGGRTRR